MERSLIYGKEARFQEYGGYIRLPLFSNLEKAMGWEKGDYLQLRVMEQSPPGVKYLRFRFYSSDSDSVPRVPEIKKIRSDGSRPYIQLPGGWTKEDGKTDAEFPIEHGHRLVIELDTQYREGRVYRIEDSYARLRQLVKQGREPKIIEPATLFPLMAITGLGKYIERAFSPTEYQEEEKGPERFYSGED